MSLTVAEDGVLPITLAAADVDLDPLTFTTVTSPAHGTLVGTPPALTYLPAANYSGPDAFTFRANDGSADSAVASVSITVTAVNEAPEAIAGSVSVAAGASATIPLSATDPDGDTLTYAIVAGPDHGALSGTPPDVIYAPSAGYAGPDGFTFRASDGNGGTATATVSITVTAAPPPPASPAASPGGCGCTTGTGAEPLLATLALLLLRRRRAARRG
jgi:uncharacterized protein (TIGR03382 family)